MESQTLGKVKMTPRGEYREETTYVPLDIVSYGGGSYCVLKHVTGVTPTGDDVNYQLLAESGADGKSPQISASKTWLVWDADAGEYVDTGVSAAGAKGDDGDPGKAPIIGSNGNWYVWDDASGAYADTGKPSRGEKGAIGAAGADGADGKDGANGITPTIGENGNWYLGETDTGKPSRGADGATGATGATGKKGADGKSAYAYAVDGGYTGTEAEFAEKLAEKMPTALPNPNALTFTGAVTGSYDGSAPLSVDIPSGGGGIGTGAYEFSVLASGTIPANTITAAEIGNGMIDTGITLGMLRQYKIFNMLYRCDSGNQYYSFAVEIPGEPLSSYKRIYYNTTNAMNATILWLDSARTAVLMLCGVGNSRVTPPANVEAMGSFLPGGLCSGGADMSAINAYGNLADFTDESKIYVGVMNMNGQETNTKDFTWAICGVIK